MGIEKYERPALALKTGALILTLVFLFTPLSSLWFISLTLLIWLQEGIWRTSQARMEQRILHVGRALQMNETVTEPFQMCTPNGKPTGVARPTSWPSIWPMPDALRWPTPTW